MNGDLKINWFFDFPPEDVWTCLTDPSLISEWLMKNDFRAEVGHKFKFQTKPLPAMGFDGIVYCEVLEVVPLRKLVYTWRGGPKPGVIELDTILTWTLLPRDGGTEIILEHKGFTGFKNYISSLFMGSGWRQSIRKRFGLILQNLKYGTKNFRPISGNC